MHRYYRSCHPVAAAIKCLDLKRLPRTPGMGVLPSTSSLYFVILRSVGFVGPRQLLGDMKRHNFWSRCAWIGIVTHCPWIPIVPNAALPGRRQLHRLTAGCQLEVFSAPLTSLRATTMRAERRTLTLGLRFGTWRSDSGVRDVASFELIGRDYAGKAFSMRYLPLRLGNLIGARQNNAPLRWQIISAPRRIEGMMSSRVPAPVDI